MDGSASDMVSIHAFLLTKAVKVCAATFCDWVLSYLGHAISWIQDTFTEANAQWPWVNG